MPEKRIEFIDVTHTEVVSEENSEFSIDRKEKDGKEEKEEKQQEEEQEEEILESLNKLLDLQIFMYTM